MLFRSKFLRATLEGQGYRLFEATSGADGVVEVGSRQPDVVIVDLGLPDMDGLDVIRRVREWTDVPVIVLSARGGERDKVTALDAGADDYVSKPFSAGELLARIRVALRHTAGASHETDDAVFQVGALRVDSYNVTSKSTPGYDIQGVIAGTRPPINPSTLPNPSGDSISRTAVTGDFGVVVKASE